MQFYQKKHKYYCGIDLHTLTMYVVISDSLGKILVESNIDSNIEEFKSIIKPYLKDIVIGVECIFSWYWIADYCADNKIDFVLGHALYMKAIHGSKTKNDKIDAQKICGLLRAKLFPTAYAYPKANRGARDLLRRRMKLMRNRAELFGHIKILGHQINDSYGNIKFRHKIHRENASERYDSACGKLNCDTDIFLIESFNKAISKIETEVLKEMRSHFPKELSIVNSIPGIGKILSMVILFEIGTIKRFETVQKFASYCRLVKCSHESAGKKYGYGGVKIGNAYLKWAFSEAAVLLIKSSDRAKKFKKRADKKYGRSKAMTLIAHRIGRSVFHMLKKERVFDESRCFGY